jgi:hypothetical protein
MSAKSGPASRRPINPIKAINYGVVLSGIAGVQDQAVSVPYLNFKRRRRRRSGHAPE